MSGMWSFKNKFFRIKNLLIYKNNNSCYTRDKFGLIYIKTNLIPAMQEINLFAKNNLSDTKNIKNIQKSHYE